MSGRIMGERSCPEGGGLGVIDLKAAPLVGPTAGVRGSCHARAPVVPMIDVRRSTRR